MKKKLLLSFLSVIILIYPVSTALFPQQADAFVSKLMGLSAKKMAKEVAKDLAIESAANFALNEAFKIADAQMAKYNQQEAYKIVCLYKTTGEVCDKPIAIKENLTEADKISIAHQAELELDKLVSPEGKGFTKWQKFMDWFGPVWITSAIMTVITYAIDSDVRNLFNEAGYNALVALGLIRPVTSDAEITNIQDENKPHSPTTQTTATSRTVTKAPGVSSTIFNIDIHEIDPVLTNEPWVYEMKINEQNANVNQIRWNIKNNFQVAPGTGISFVNYFTMTKLNFSVPVALYPSGVNGTSLKVAKNGETIFQSTPTLGTNGTILNWSLPAEVNIEVQRTTAVRTRFPYKIGDFYYTDVLVFTVDGDQMHYQIKSPEFRYTDNVFNYSEFYMHFDTSQVSSGVNTITYNADPRKQILPPMYEETQEQAPQGTYEDDKGNIALVPPVAIPLEQISTGKKVTLEPNPIPGGEPIATNEDGEPVPDDDIQTNGDPVVTPSPTPEGSPTVTPQPTPSNPTPQPQPLTPTPTPTAPPTPTPIETSPPVFPEGESCSEGLKFPKFKQLGSTVSNAFPFSLPFDIYDGFNNVFSDIGTEKPEFEYKFTFMGDEQIWKIGLPDYFDSWKKFTDITLIVFFDITLLYLFNRFFGAMGSD